jgi:hypothetical protein
MSKPLSSETDFILSPEGVRAGAAQMLELALSGGTGFKVHLDKLGAVADLVARITRENYPSLEVPFHSRWRHFQTGGIDRMARIRGRVANQERNDRARCLIDLAVVSVLLDAGAGMAWHYQESESGKVFSKSEGLAVASFHLFMNGTFSSDAAKPWQADAAGLSEFSGALLARGFQVTPENPLVGLDGRVELLRRLGETLTRDPERFPPADGAPPRPGDLLTFLRSKAKNGEISAATVLKAVLRGFGPIWPGRIEREGVNLGDVWSYPKLGLIPFHKLSQWLTYSLIEPIVESGLRVSNIDGLTGLAEYRNGGLMLDSGLIELRDPADQGRAWKPDSERIIEWRALTVALLDRLAPEVRARLGKLDAQFPLVKVLEGGTWWAGRRLAAEARADGGPPFKVESDGTLF